MGWCHWWSFDYLNVQSQSCSRSVTQGALLVFYLTNPAWSWDSYWMKSKGRSTSIQCTQFTQRSQLGFPLEHQNHDRALALNWKLQTLAKTWWLFPSWMCGDFSSWWKIWRLFILMSKYLVNISIYFDHHERPGDYFHHDESEKQLGGVAIVFKVVFYKFTTIVFKVVRICPPPPGSALITFMAICLWHWAQLDVAAPRAPDKVKKDWILKVIFL